MPVILFHFDSNEDINVMEEEVQQVKKKAS